MTITVLGTPVEEVRLFRKALKAIPGSQTQKDITKELNKLREARGVRPLK